MKYLSLVFLGYWLSLLSSVGVVNSSAKGEGDKLEPPTVLIAVILRNKAHVLPYFFGYLEQQSYPKSRISLWIYTDHNVDQTAEIVDTWAEAVLNEYHNVNLTSEDGEAFFPDEEGSQKWTAQRYWHVIRLREEAIQVARTLWADFIFFLDGDAMLSNPKTIQDLVEENRTIIAPMLDSRSAYSNFWCGMNEKGYYERTDEYMPILEREKVGVFPVVMVHSATLINLNHAHSRKLTYDPQKLEGYTGPNDDVITFAHSAKFAAVEMFISNKDQYGHILAPTESPANEAEELLNLKLDVTVDGEPLLISPTLQSFVVPPRKDTLGFDQVYLINLERRPERRKRMEYCFEELGIAFKFIAAVDGKKLNDSYIRENGIRMLPEYADPYHNRPITAGEIGCFMSHYNIWKDMIENQHRIALIFEDDIRFEPYFRTKIGELLTEVRHLDWDLIYLGRKRLSGSKEPLVTGSSRLVHVDYSYWTLCYALTLAGARKLVDADPLPRMVPVDEYLPIMFDKHPEKVWAAHFPRRDLKAFSVHPLFVHPTHYTGEEHYISDTEDSVVVDTLNTTDSDPGTAGVLAPADVASEPETSRDEL